MARPRNADPARTRARILERAAELFAEGGERVSTRALAKSAGVSLATLHHHFGTKHDLYLACVEAMYSAFGGLRDEVAGSGVDSPRAWVVETVLMSYRFACAHRAAVRLTTRDAIEQGSVSRERQREVLLPALAQGAEVLAHWTGEDELELRLVLRSVAFLVIRYALVSPDELTAVVGQDLNEEALQERVGQHLARLALRTLGLEDA
jgi:AcrR family transcriptional regulator